MTVSISAIAEACHLFFERSREPAFLKSSRIAEWGEREGILPALKWFLLGYFGSSVKPEAIAQSGTKKRFDFVLGDVAIEVGVRKRASSKSSIGNYVMTSELEKLIRYPGTSVLVILDYAKEHLTRDELDANFRGRPSFGKGNYKRWPFNVLYYHVTEAGSLEHFRMNIKPN